MNIKATEATVILQILATLLNVNLKTKAKHHKLCKGEKKENC